MPEEIPDPHGTLAKLKARLPKHSAVKRNPYCEHILALRLQGHSLTSISKWLEDKGPEYYISAASLSRNFHVIKTAVQLPYAEELAEEWGGNIDLDLAHELKRQILTQRTRIDALVRDEAHTKKHNKSISFEMKVLVDLVKQLSVMLKSPLEAAEERVEARQMLAATDDVKEPDLALTKQLEEFILNGTLENTALKKLVN